MLGDITEVTTISRHGLRFANAMAKMEDDKKKGMSASKKENTQIDRRQSIDHFYAFLCGSIMIRFKNLRRPSFMSTEHSIPDNPGEA